MFELLLICSQWAVPLLILFILGVGWCKKVPMYEVFIQGAFEGIRTTIRLAPYILAIFIAVGLFRMSGALGLVMILFNPLLGAIGLSPDLLTLGIIKPLSGSASLGITAELLNKWGPDSSIGLMASIAQGCSETTLYVLSLYLGAVGIKDSRHLLAMGLVSEMSAFWVAIGLGTLISQL